MKSGRSHLYWRSDLHLSVRTDPEPCGVPIGQSDAPLTIKDLEAGLRLLDRMDTDQAKFWDEKGRAFRATVRLAIRETTEALLLQKMSRTLRNELEEQLAWLTAYLRLQERH